MDLIHEALAKWNAVYVVLKFIKHIIALIVQCIMQEWFYEEYAQICSDCTSWIYWSYARESLTSRVLLDEIIASVSIFHERRHVISAASLAVSKFTAPSKNSSQKKHLVFLRLLSCSVFQPSYFICWNAAFMKLRV